MSWNIEHFSDYYSDYLFDNFSIDEQIVKFLQNAILVNINNHKRMQFQLFFAIY